MALRRGEIKRRGEDTGAGYQDKLIGTAPGGDRGHAPTPTAHLGASPAAKGPTEGRSSYPRKNGERPAVRWRGSVPESRLEIHAAKESPVAVIEQCNRASRCVGTAIKARRTRSRQPRFRVPSIAPVAPGGARGPLWGDIKSGAIPLHFLGILP
jgi:hypothetical protein